MAFIKFLSTPSARRATDFVGEHSGAGQFLSTPSARRATPAGRTQPQADGNFYPRPPRGGRLRQHHLHDERRKISIHALREEGDQNRAGGGAADSNFYPRPPRGGRPQAIADDDGEWEFLSTPSARRATARCSSMSWAQSDFYPRPPRGGRPLGIGTISPIELISIHALREEGDRVHAPGEQHIDHFYPRPPRGGRPPDQTPCSTSENFYPRPPRGGRRVLVDVLVHRLVFLSTPSARRATVLFQDVAVLRAISIHALREEGDPRPFPQPRIRL